MGLDVSHGCWSGAYSSFKRFRHAVAEAAREQCGYEPDYDAHPFRAFMGWWWEGDGSTMTHALDPFFIHSDCDGYLFPSELHDLIPALTRLLPHVKGERYPGRTNAADLAEFIAGLQRALDDYEPVRFS